MSISNLTRDNNYNLYAQSLNAEYLSSNTLSNKDNGDINIYVNGNQKLTIGDGSIDMLIPLNVQTPTANDNATTKNYVDGAISAAINGVHPQGNLNLTGDLTCDDIVANGNIQVKDGLTVSNPDASSKFIFSLYDVNGTTHKMDFYNNYSAEGTNNKVVSSIQCVKGSNNDAGELSFLTSNSNADSLTEQLRIAQDGDIAMTNSLNVGLTLNVNNGRFELLDGGDLVLNSDASLSVSGSANIGASLNVDNGRLNVIDGGNVSINAILDMNNKTITNVLDPVNLQDASTKNYVDNAISNIDGITDGILHFYSGLSDGECYMEFVNGDEQTGTRYGFIGIPSNGATSFDIATASSIPTITFAPEGVDVLSLNDTSVMMNKPLNMNSQAINGLLDPVNLQDGATKNYVDTQLLNYATTTDLNNEVAIINSDLTTNYALKSELPDLSGYATTTALNAEVATINSDLTTNYALKSELTAIKIGAGHIDWIAKGLVITGVLYNFFTPINNPYYLIEVVLIEITGSISKGAGIEIYLKNNTSGVISQYLHLEDYLTHTTSTAEYFTIKNAILNIQAQAGDEIVIGGILNSGTVNFDANNDVNYYTYPI